MATIRKNTNKKLKKKKKEIALKAFAIIYT